jgi:hypothetical protein
MNLYSKSGDFKEGEKCDKIELTKSRLESPIKKTGTIKLNKEVINEMNFLEDFGRQDLLLPWGVDLNHCNEVFSFF